MIQIAPGSRACKSAAIVGSAVLAMAVSSEARPAPNRMATSARRSTPDCAVGGGRALAGGGEVDVAATIAVGVGAQRQAFVVEASPARRRSALFAEKRSMRLEPTSGAHEVTASTQRTGPHPCLRPLFGGCLGGERNIRGLPEHGRRGIRLSVLRQPLNLGLPHPFPSGWFRPRRRPERYSRHGACSRFG